MSALVGKEDVPSAGMCSYPLATCDTLGAAHNSLTPLGHFAFDVKPSLEETEKTSIVCLCELRSCLCPFESD